MNKLKERLSSRKGDSNSNRNSAHSIESMRKRASIRVLNFFSRNNSVCDRLVNTSANDEIVGDLVIMVQDDGVGIRKVHHNPFDTSVESIYYLQ